MLLPLAALVASGFSAQQAVDEAAHGRVQRAADMLHEHALRALESQELSIAAVEQRMLGMAWADVPGDRALHDFLRALNAVNINSGGLALINPRGLMVMSSARPLDNTPVDVSARDYIAANREGSASQRPLFVGQVVESAIDGVPFFPVVRARTRPDRLSDGGIILASLWPRNFQAFYDSILETPEDTVTLFRLDGAVLAAVPAPDGPEDAALPREAGEMLSSLRRSRALTIHGPSPIDGVPRLTSFRRLVRYDLGIAYGLSEQAMTQDWMRRMLSPLAGSALAMLLLLMAVWQAERAMRSRSLAEAIARAAERQATLGLLAGGLAHDFGNITQSVGAAARLLTKYAEDTARVRLVAEHLDRHATRATALSRRLLDTTRRSNPEALPGAAPVDVTASLHEIAELLNATLGPGIRVRCDVPPGLRSAPGVDRAELETALINLAANARDAMPRGGEVRISAHRLRIPPHPEDAPTLAAGPYLRITVRDSGHGMPPEALARLGEPFFTTKPEGQGSGLGLAMVAAFLRGVGGMLSADSTPGQGTAVHLLLPAS